MSWNLKNIIKDTIKSEVYLEEYQNKLGRPIAFLYPNVYHLGMSNLGLHIIYQIINKRSDSFCERVFLPERKLIDEYKRTRTPILSYEKQRPLADFQIIFVMISSHDHVREIAVWQARYRYIFSAYVVVCCEEMLPFR